MTGWREAQDWMREEVVSQRRQAQVPWPLGKDVWECSARWAEECCAQAGTKHLGSTHPALQYTPHPTIHPQTDKHASSQPPPSPPPPPTHAIPPTLSRLRRLSL